MFLSYYCVKKCYEDLSLWRGPFLIKLQALQFEGSDVQKIFVRRAFRDVESIKRGKWVKSNTESTWQVNFFNEEFQNFSLKIFAACFLRSVLRTLSNIYKEAFSENS